MKYSKLENLRKEKKVTYQNLADHLGISRQGLSKMIKNKTCTVEVLERLADYFGVSILWFFDKETPAEEPRAIYNTADKDRIIADLRLANDLLKEKLDNCCQES
jgi:transcriptional regulator with XRE-family HTH domain